LPGRASRAAGRPRSRPRGRHAFHFRCHLNTGASNTDLAIRPNPRSFGATGGKNALAAGSNLARDRDTDQRHAHLRYRRESRLYPNSITVTRGASAAWTRVNFTVRPDVTRCARAARLGPGHRPTRRTRTGHRASGGFCVSCRIPKIAGLAAKGQLARDGGSGIARLFRSVGAHWRSLRWRGHTLRPPGRDRRE
jgi:hypothetical protein